MTELKDSSVFQLSRVENRPYEIDGPVLVAGIDIQNNLHLTELVRETYTLLDVLSDVGGFSTALISLFLTIERFLNNSHLDNYMASWLFKIEAEKPGVSDP